MFNIQSSTVVTADLETCKLERKASSDIFGSPVAENHHKDPSSSSEELDELPGTSTSEWDFLRQPGALEASKELVLRMECLSPWELKVRTQKSFV